VTGAFVLAMAAALAAGAAAAPGATPTRAPAPASTPTPIPAPVPGPSWRGLVVVLVPPVDDAITRNARARISGELAAAPFKTVTALIDPGADLMAQVEAVAAERKATAAFAIVRADGPSSDRITILISNRVTGTTTVQRMAVDEQDVDRAASRLAVEAVELVRASLEGAWPAPVVAAPAPAPPPRPARVQIDVGAGVVTDLQGGPAFWLPTLAVIYPLPRSVGARVALGGLGRGADVATVMGSAHLDLADATLGLTRAFRPERRLQPMLSVAAGACRLAVRGAAASPALAHDRAAWSALTSAGGGVVVALVPRVALTLQAEMLLVWSTMTVEIAGREPAELDHLAIAAHAGLFASF